MSGKTRASGAPPSGDPGRRGAHPAGFETAQQGLFRAAGLEVTSRLIEGATGRIHVLEAGPASSRPPLVFVHGTGAFGAFFAPVMARLPRRRTVAFDRPGYGLSDPFLYTETDLGAAVADALGDVIAATGADRVDLVGHSMGGQAAIRFALDRPHRVRRLVLLGAVVGFPGTRPPLPIRLLTVPLLGDVLHRAGRAGEEGVLDVAEIFGEREAIREHPAFIRAVAAHEADPGRARVGLSEFRALASVRGWRPPVRLAAEELRRIPQPTAVLWGTEDPLGTPEDAGHGVASIPRVRFESVEAGHIPFLGHPERCARLVRGG